MIGSRQLVAWGAAIVLTITSCGYARADDAAADDGSEQTDVIEEIVVVGKEKSQHPHFGSSSDSNRLLQKPRRTDWQFLPRYDPEQRVRNFDLIQHDEAIRRAGLIELFRVRFGR